MRRAASPQTVCALIVVLSILAFPASAPAFYDNGFDGVPGAFLISADYARLEQGDDTTKFATIASDGRYVAIETFARNFFADDDPDPEGGYRTGGIFRFDLETRALEKVADGNLFQEGGENAFVRRGASNPSISADGRYIVFFTAQQLIPTDTNENVDVYRRDMKIPLPAGDVCKAESPCPYQLVSARDGGVEPAHYGPPSFPFPGSEPGADVSRGVAISANGQRVAFRTGAPSDLPASASTDVPAGQVFVRDLTTETTTLVTETRDSDTNEMTDQPAGGAQGAALSADGTTVAWTGSNAAAQTRFLKGENQDSGFYYYLWRRVADGPGAPTRRITGLADPDDPQCPEEVETVFDLTSTGPCFGPLTDQEGNRADITSKLPVLSGDGYTVAFVTGAGARPIASTGPGLDLYLTKMTPGLTRKQATTELTRDPAGSDPATSPPISGVAMSPSGRFLAITTSRTQFTLPALKLIGAPRAVPGPHELYLIDLREGTIERAAHSISGGDINGEVLDGATLSADATRIAFTSFAGNLFFGDANQRADAFVVTREPEPSPEGPADNAQAGETSVETFGPGPHISARVRSSKGRIAILSVSVPAAGKLTAVAHASTAGGRSREVAAGRSRARRKGRVSLRMRMRRSLLGMLRRRHRIRTRTRITFTPAGTGRRLRTSLRVSFFSRSSPVRHK